MKKLARAFVTALVLTMMLSMGMFAGALTFSDSMQIKYNTAVGVMSSAGILNGYTDGSFQPLGLITRQEATKIVTYAAIGEKGVIALPKEKTEFTDVDIKSWAAPYINWCVGNGIIEGVGNDEFHPLDNVTGYQLAKMMLCATGYGKNGEYSGKGWDLQTAKDAFAKGVFAGIENADPSINVTREEASLYVFNAMTKIEQVIYDNETGKYVPEDGTEKHDNTFGSEVYGIVDTHDYSTIHRGILTESCANGAKATLVGDKTFDYYAAPELLGHEVEVYTNGKTGIKSKVYYIADCSETIDVPCDINSKERFSDVFGGKYMLDVPVFVYSDNCVLSNTKQIPNFSITKHTAPAGTYVFANHKMISYIPHIKEFSAVLSEPVDGQIKIGNQQYPIEKVVYENNELTEGDLVLAKLYGDMLHLNKANVITSNNVTIKTDTDGEIIFLIGNATYSKSKIQNESDKTIPKTVQNGKFYIVFFDSNSDIIAIV